jgi:hypothetical protein
MVKKLGRNGIDAFASADAFWLLPRAGSPPKMGHGSRLLSIRRC